MNCKNKRIISILIASGILLSPNNVQAMENTIDFINEDSKPIEDNIDEIAKEESIESEEDIVDTSDILEKNTILKENKEILADDLQNEDDTNIVEGLVYKVVLDDGQFVPDFIDNANEYETIKVTTNGSKKLVEKDYANLRSLGIPKIDLSSAQSDSIPDGAFAYLSTLKEFKFPKGITKIGDQAFMSCSGLTGKLELPDTLTDIGNLAFNFCSGLSGELKLPDSLVSIGERAFVSCTGFRGELVIPDSVTTIGDSVFGYCDGFKKLKLSESLKSIGANAFMGLTGLTGELIIPESVEFIGESAFEGCTGFSGNLILPDSLKTLSDGVFGGCTGFDGTLKLPDTLETIGFATFNGCTGFKGDLVIPNSVKTIGNRAFRDCEGFSGDLVIPNSVTTIGSYSFSGCKGLNGKLKIGDSVTNIETGAFYKCTGLSGELKLPNSITNIGTYAFAECNKFSGDIVIPNSLVTLGENVFKNTKNIEKVIIASGEGFEDSNYRKSIIDKLDKSKVLIDLPYNFTTVGTWLETEFADKLVKPVIKKIVDGEEVDYDNTPSEQIVLLLEVPYEEDDITVLKDENSYGLPAQIDGKYIFDKDGSYQVTIKTSTGTVSNITFEVKSVMVDDDIVNPNPDAPNAPDENPVEPEPPSQPSIDDVLNEGGEGSSAKPFVLKVNTLDGLEKTLKTIVNSGSGVALSRLGEVVDNGSEVIYKLHIVDGVYGYYVDIKVDKTKTELTELLDRIYVIVEEDDEGQVPPNNKPEELPPVTPEQPNVPEGDSGDDIRPEEPDVPGDNNEDNQNPDSPNAPDDGGSDDENNSGTPEDTIRPEDDIIENLPQIEGIEFGEGNASIGNPLSIKVTTLDGLKELLDLTSTSNLNVDSVKQVDDDNDFLVYLLELTKNSNARAQKSYFIEIKVAKTNQEVINKLEDLVEQDNINNETNNDAVLDEELNNNSSNNNNNNSTNNNVSNNNSENTSNESNKEESPKTYDGGVSSYILSGIGSIALLSILKKKSMRKK